MPQAPAYTYSATQQGDIFVARVLEFPSLAAHGDTKEEALEEIEKVVSFAIEDLEAEGEYIPQPYK